MPRHVVNRVLVKIAHRKMQPFPIGDKRSSMEFRVDCHPRILVRGRKLLDDRLQYLTEVDFGELDLLSR